MIFFLKNIKKYLNLTGITSFPIKTRQKGLVILIVLLEITDCKMLPANYLEGKIKK